MDEVGREYDSISVHNSNFCVRFYIMWCLFTIIIPLICVALFYEYISESPDFILFSIPIYLFVQIDLAVRLSGRVHVAHIAEDGIYSTVYGIKRVDIPWNNIKYCGVYIYRDMLLQKSVYLLLSTDEISEDYLPPRHYKTGKQISLKLSNIDQDTIDIINSKLGLSINSRELFEEMTNATSSCCLIIYEINQSESSANTQNINREVLHLKRENICIYNSGSKWHNRFYNSWLSWTLLFPVLVLVWNLIIGTFGWQYEPTVILVFIAVCLLIQVIMLFLMGGYLCKTIISAEGISSSLGCFKISHLDWEQVRYVGLYALASHEDSRCMIISTYLLLSSEKILPKHHPILCFKSKFKIVVRISLSNVANVVEILNSKLGLSLNKEELLSLGKLKPSGEYPQEVYRALPFKIIDVESRMN